MNADSDQDLKSIAININIFVCVALFQHIRIAFYHKKILLFRLETLNSLNVFR